MIRRSSLPVFARAIVPNAGGAEYLGEIGVTVQCAGQVVRPGDWLVGDEDGVIVIPAERVDEVLARAQRIVAAERKIERSIRAGEDLGGILRSEEIIQKKASEVFIPQLRANGPRVRESKKGGRNK
jgi:3-hexulose-6-phosphate synthase/6-phospho-3-hexuloisomerase